MILSEYICLHSYGAYLHFYNIGGWLSLGYIYVPENCQKCILASKRKLPT